MRRAFLKLLVQGAQLPDQVRRERAAQVAVALANALLGDDGGDHDDDDHHLAEAEDGDGESLTGQDDTAPGSR